MVIVSVIGCGLLGSKIAGELAYQGHTVKVYDSNTKALQSMFARLQQDKGELQAAGILQHHTFVGQVICLSHLHEAVSNVQFIFEAIKEDLDAKQQIFERISQCCSESAIIATSSLRLNLNAITLRTLHPERTMAVRFLYPVYCIPEVEVIMGQQTSLSTLHKVSEFLERMGKTMFFRSGPEPLVLSQEQRDRRILGIKKRLKSVLETRTVKCTTPLELLIIEEKLGCVLETRRVAQSIYARKEQVNLHKGLSTQYKYLIPELAHAGNFAPSQDGDQVVRCDIEKECSICMNRARDCVFHPCHHMCTCADCGRLLASRRDSCPICRTSIMEVIRIFHC